MSIFNIKCVEVALIDGREVELCIGDEVRMVHTEDNRVPKFLDGEWMVIVGFTAARRVVVSDRVDMNSGLRKLTAERHISDVRQALNLDY